MSEWIELTNNETDRVERVNVAQIVRVYDDAGALGVMFCSTLMVNYKETVKEFADRVRAAKAEGKQP